jgi:MFS family permease
MMEHPELKPIAYQPQRTPNSLGRIPDLGWLKANWRVSKFLFPNLMMSDSKTILWRQVWGVAALLAAIVLSFTIYGIYQPKILTELGFTRLAVWFGIIQGFLGGIVEPCFGYLSDRCLRRLGSRLPQIVVGVTGAGLIFLLVALIDRGNLISSLAWLIPLLMALWVTAMIAVRGPIVALLQQFAPTGDLPSANGVLVLVLGLVGAIAPLLERVLLSGGISIAFVIGAIAILLGALIFYGQTPRHSLSLLLPVPESVPLGLRVSRRIFLLGVGVGLTLALTRSLLGQSLNPALPTAGILSFVLTIAAICAYPLGTVTKRLGAGQALQVALGAIALIAVVVLGAKSFLFSILVMILMGLALGLLFDAMIPLVLSMASATTAGFGTGLYFGGYGIGNVLLDLSNQCWGKLSPAYLTIAIFVVVALTIFRLSPKQTH